MKLLNKIRRIRFYQLFVSLFKVTFRNRTAFFFSLLFPLIFMGIFGLAFQEGDPTNTTIHIGYVNNDLGIPDQATVIDLSGNTYTQFQVTTQYLDILHEITFQDNQTQVFDLVHYDDIDQAISDLERQNIKALLIIPQDFSLGYLAAIRKAAENLEPGFDWQGYPSSSYQTAIQVSGDNSLVQFNIASTVLKEVTQQYFKIGVSQENIKIDLRSSIDSRGFTAFDIVVPGMVIFAIISNANTVAAMALHDVESEMIYRLRLTKMKKWEYPAAVLLSQLFLAYIQIPILFGTALLFGFPFTPKILIAFLFAAFVSLAMSGIGLILASLTSNAEAVGALSAIITTPMSFLAGAFFAVPSPQLLSLSDNLTIGLFDLLPPTRAITALRLVLFNGYTLVEVLPDLLITCILSITYLALGIFLYSRKHLVTR